jgi:hypothetical protein
MPEPTLEQLASRIALLEQRLRSVALILLAVIVVTFGFYFLQVWGHKTVEAESFVLRSSEGKTRAALSTLSGVSAALMMADDKGTPRIFLSIGANGVPGLAMADAGGTQRVLLTTLPNGTPSLGMYDADKKLRAILGVDPSGTPALALYDADQNLRAKFDH